MLLRESCHDSVDASRQIARRAGSAVVSRGWRLPRLSAGRVRRPRRGAAGRADGPIEGIFRNREGEGRVLLVGDPAALRFLDLVAISLDPLEEGQRMRTLTNRADMHGVEMFRS